jgi:hypothetical protein
MIEIIGNKRKEYLREYYKTHKSECCKRYKRRYEENKDTILATNKLYRDNHKEEISDNKRRYYLEHLTERAQYNITHKDYIKAKQQEYLKSGKTKMTQEKYRINHPGVKMAYKLRIKTEVLTHYGNGKCACVKCGFSDIRALSIDHINGNGSQERNKKVRVFCYNWLRSNNYPDGYQTLCMNCQFIKRIEQGEHRWRKSGSDKDVLNIGGSTHS